MLLVCLCQNLDTQHKNWQERKNLFNLTLDSHIWMVEKNTNSNVEEKCELIFENWFAELCINDTVIMTHAPRSIFWFQFGTSNFQIHCWYDNIYRSDVISHFEAAKKCQKMWISGLSWAHLIRAYQTPYRNPKKCGYYIWYLVLCHLCVFHFLKCSSAIQFSNILSTFESVFISAITYFLLPN